MTSELRPAVEVEELNSLLEYDPETGFFVWQSRNGTTAPAASWDARLAGKKAGWVNAQGYVYINIHNRSHRAHRVAWAMYHGSWPDGQIDHINGNRSDNRIANLRIVNNAENSKNQCKRVNNTSGTTGVTWSKQRGKWQAQIVRHGKIKNLGHYANKDDAIAARKKAEQEMEFHPNHGREAYGTRYHNI